MTKFWNRTKRPKKDIFSFHSRNKTLNIIKNTHIYIYIYIYIYIFQKWFRHIPTPFWYTSLSLPFFFFSIFPSYNPSLFSFLIINFLLCWTWEKLVILMKSFWNKDEISFLNPLSVFWFIHFTTYFFSSCRIYQIYHFPIYVCVCFSIVFQYT